MSGDSSIADIHPLAALLRGFAVDFLTSHDVSVVPDIMSEQYCLRIGEHTLDGRDSQYLPPTKAQITQFPGLCVTVHDVVYGDNALAMQFTEHGASTRDGGRVATWRGITLFRTDGERLHRGWAEEDYFARKRQLSSGSCDAVDAPHPSPWDVPRAQPDQAAEDVARAWLCAPQKMAELEGANWLSAIGADDPPPRNLLDVETTKIDELFSAGDRVAFHLEHHGAYTGGFPDLDAALIGKPAVLRAAGLLTVREHRVVAARITSDRLGLYRALRFG
ncbi:MAG: hypothetical protein ACI9DH_000008 [Halioglobus sp.]|jgi:hypothetical protein